MNEHVTGIGPTLANKLPTLKELFTKFLDKNKSPATSFFFCNISPNEVKLEILYMSNNKSYGFHSCPVSIPNPVTFLFFFLRAFLQWQVVTGMKAEKIIESLANYIWFLRVPIAVCISHLFLIDRRTPGDL